MTSPIKIPRILDDLPLYASEDEIARAVLGENRVKDWPAIAAIDERKGLPGIDPLHGGRYWPAVQRFYDMLNLPDGNQAGPAAQQGAIRIIPLAPDGEENFDGEKATALQGRRRDRRAIRARS
jgi:hypothetical protein